MTPNITLDRIFTIANTTDAAYCVIGRQIDSPQTHVHHIGIFLKKTGLVMACFSHSIIFNPPKHLQQADAFPHQQPVDISP